MRPDIAATTEIYSQLRTTRPRTRADVRNYVKAFLGVDIPDQSLCFDHSSPMDYLWHCYNCDFDSSLSNGDCVVWAGRGGGKTFIAAIATLLDCLFKPGCQTRILAGSQAQASRLYDYLVGFINDGFEDFLAMPIRKNRCDFKNASSVEVLTSSAASVRGTHVHKLRCDEVELFDAQIFEAAKFVTQSTGDLLAAMEVISTMHQPFGLMHKLVVGAELRRTPVFKWCIWEVIERCQGRSCSRCPLDNYCQSRAKIAGGYLKIDDCITQMKRSSRAGFESEMLCKRPSRANVVFEEFDPDIHVAEVGYDAELPIYRAIDFGFVNPFVCLWLQVDQAGTVRVIDEYIKTRTTIFAHADELKNRTPCPEGSVVATFCDPAGVGRNDVTGSSPVSVLRRGGMKLRYRKSSIVDGVELVRRALRSGRGESKLIISPKCGRLIEAMQCYHYPDTACAGEVPKKDGTYDHPIDALRYFFINYRSKTPAKARRY